MLGLSSVRQLTPAAGGAPFPPIILPDSFSTTFMLIYHRPRAPLLQAATARSGVGRFGSERNDMDDLFDGSDTSLTVWERDRLPAKRPRETINTGQAGGWFSSRFRTSWGSKVGVKLAR